MSKDFVALKLRYLSDPLEIQIGGLASNLSRLGWFIKRSTTIEKLQPILRESKYFTEWAADHASLELQNALAEVQLELAILERKMTRGESPLSYIEQADSWAVKLLRLAGLRND